MFTEADYDGKKYMVALVGDCDYDGEMPTKGWTIYSITRKAKFSRFGYDSDFKAAIQYGRSDPVALVLYDEETDTVTVQKWHGPILIQLDMNYDVTKLLEGMKRACVKAVEAYKTDEEVENIGVVA
jgi:hypothetical protein